ncbi:hypothetical protein KGM_211462 [Danaus plexippus plexippus]|uniref:Uncharacterized protein n=1 Tax=Danaus plexippus plexippus TaxID=278856 RepID=A0A212FIB7_DANPL|nr:hypothetical protein KGM_211462 [Danaus plexippus plexippus]
MCDRSNKTRKAFETEQPVAGKPVRASKSPWDDHSEAEPSAVTVVKVSISPYLPRSRQVASPTTHHPPRTVS